MKSGTSRLAVRRISGAKVQRLEDFVVRERPATIFLDDVEIAALMCTPKDLDYLAVGFLFAEGFVKGRKDLRRVFADDKDGAVWVYTKKAQKLPIDIAGRRFVTTGCGRGVTFADSFDIEKRPIAHTKHVLPASSVPNLMKEFLRRSRLFRVTGGAHSAALCNSRDVLVFNEDIGRHSAIDKVFGECIMKGIPMHGRILATSGRISSEILAKVARSRVPIVISKSAPTDLAIKLADEIGVALVGFARGSRMNVYSAGWRISTRPKVTARSHK